jgi:putative ATP-dependent endonuclease of OLD family
MRLVEVKLTNFRGYRTETSVPLEAMTTLVGKNDAGKSSILDALDIFFNDTTIERDDRCVHTGIDTVTISCVFEDPPPSLVIDATASTTLAAEYLLRRDGRLEIVKSFSCGAAKGKLLTTEVVAEHPSAAGLADLLALKISDLKSRAGTRNVNLAGVNQTVKSELRKAIWSHAAPLALTERRVTLESESGKEIWQQIAKSLPVFALFKSDRASTDQDSEAQDPMKAAVKEAIKHHDADLSTIVDTVKTQLEASAERTVAKIAELSPGLASELIPQVKNKPWDGLFSVSLTGDDAIPMNKRGSGARRLVLLAFFRAKAEEVINAASAGVIYAIEEPETSQHPNQQLALLAALQDLAETNGCQVLLTTHTPTLARRVPRSSLRLVLQGAAGPVISMGSDDAALGQIRTSLGVLPDHDVKVFFGVEGRHDIVFLRRVSKILHAADAMVPDLEDAESAGVLVFVPLGGSNLDLWVTRLAGLNVPEFYLTDRDVPPPGTAKYQTAINDWNARGCTAWATSKRELENYLHVDILRTMSPTYSGLGTDPFEDVPALFALSLHEAASGVGTWATLSEECKSRKVSRAKRRLNDEAASQMTAALLAHSDPNGELTTWLTAVGHALRR